MPPHASTASRHPKSPVTPRFAWSAPNAPRLSTLVARGRRRGPRLFRPIWLALALLMATFASHGAERLDFEEVRTLLESQLPDVDKADLGDAAARGMIDRLNRRVRLMGATNTQNGGTQPPKAPLTTVFDEAYALFKWTELGADSAAALRESWRNLNATNSIRGMILDLRFAASSDYAAAVAVADLFVAQETPLIDWGAGMKSSTEKGDAIQIPLVLLVNELTAEACEALAATLQSGAKALVIGTATAGLASQCRDFTLSSGHVLRVAIQPVRIGSSDELSPEGLAPDIEVLVPLVQQKAWFNDPYLPSPNRATSTQTANAPAGPQRRRLSEADLVRMMREGELPGFETGAPSDATEPLPPQIQDPMLARALDFLRGLSVVRQFLSD